MDIPFVVAIGTATSWRSQGSYDLSTYLSMNDATQVERDLAHEFNEGTRDLSGRDADYDEYLRFVENEHPRRSSASTTSLR